MDKEELTTRQQQILDYIRKCIEVKHYPPSVREIGQAIGLSSPSTVHAHLNALEAKGFIKRDGAKSRSMVITGSKDEARERAKVEPRTEFNGHSLVELPLVGRVAAGTPILGRAKASRRRSLSPPQLFGDRIPSCSPCTGFHDQRGHL